MQFNSQAQNPVTSVQELVMTQSEMKDLQKLLPQGYSFVLVSRKSKAQRPKRQEQRTHTTQQVPTATKNERTKRKAYEEAERTIRGISESFKICKKVLDAIKRNYNAGPFLEPVNPEALGIPTYFDIIKNPMDLGTVEKKLKEHQYNDPTEFEEDMRLIWRNATTFNPKGTQVYIMAEEMGQAFESELKREKDYANGIRPAPNIIKQRIRGYEEETNRKRPQSRGFMDKPMNYNEKKNLSNMIRMLPTDHLWGVWNIVSGGDTNKNNGELEFDIETLPIRTARELEKFVKQKIASLNKKKKTGVKKVEMDVIPQKFKEEMVDNGHHVPKETIPQPQGIVKKTFEKEDTYVAPPVENKVAPNFVIENVENRRDLSESSLISGLDDSD